MILTLTPSCRAASLQEVLDTGADYVISVNVSSGGILDIMEEIFEDIDLLPANHLACDTVIRSSQTMTLNSRTVRHDIYAMPAEKVLKRTAVRWPEVRTLIAAHTSEPPRKTGTTTSRELTVDFYLSSLEIIEHGRSFADKLMNVVTRHMPDDPKRHLLDITFCQDRIPVRSCSYAKNRDRLAELTGAVLSQALNSGSRLSRPLTISGLKEMCSNSPTAACRLCADFFTGAGKLIPEAAVPGESAAGKNP